MKLTINPKFQSRLPSCRKETDAELERQLVATEGPLEPITTWKGQIVDGHRRHAICERLDLPFTVRPLDLETEEEVLKWIDSFQISRRNLKDNEFAETLARMTRDRMGEGKAIEPTAKEVADAVGVSSRTVRRAIDHDDNLKKLAPEVRKAVSELPVTRKEVEKLAEMPVDDQKGVVKQVKSGEFKTVAEAMFGEGSKSAKAALDSPPLKKPHKPIRDVLKEATDHLGRLRKSLDMLSEIDNINFRLKEMNAAAKSIALNLKSWSDEQE